MYYLKQFDMYIFECSLNVDDNFISYDKKRSHDHVMKTLVIFVLDLRWNSVGLLGGRAILEMLKTNKTICRLELAGNNIPGDILKSIGKIVCKSSLNISYKMFYLFMYIIQILSLLETYIQCCFSYVKRNETDNGFPTMIYMYCIHRI